MRKKKAPIALPANDTLETEAIEKDANDVGNQEPQEKGIYSLFPYFGGKYKLCRNIHRLTPKHTVHAELFCGSATVTLNRKEPAEVEIINDRDPFLINCMRVIQNPKTFKEFDKRIQKYKYDRFEFYSINKKYYEPHKEALHNTRYRYPDVNSAILFFVLISQGYGGLLRAGFAGDTKGRVEAWDKRKERLEYFHRRLKRVIIENDDYSVILNKYAKKYKDSIFFYVDPPYSASERVVEKIKAHLKKEGQFVDSALNDYSFEMTNWQHQELVSRLAMLESKYGSKFLISNYASEKNVLYNSFLGYCNRVEFNAVSDTGAITEDGKRKPRIEVMWANYKVNKGVLGKLKRFRDFNHANRDADEFFNSPEWKAYEALMNKHKRADGAIDFEKVYDEMGVIAEPPKFTKKELKEIEESQMSDEEWEKYLSDAPTYEETLAKNLPR